MYRGKTNPEFNALIEQEGWDIISTPEGNPAVAAMNKVFPYAHPFSIHAKLVKEESNPDLKFNSLKAMHDYAWPQYAKTWNYWDERRFRTFCEGYTYVSYAGGASTGKSHCSARLALLFEMISPKTRTVIVASTTLSALSVRIWGYITRLVSELRINFPLHLYGGQSPRILYDKRDPIHGMYAVAAGKGTDEKAIANWIGRHPKEAMMLILDEAPDLDPVLLKSLPNLESGSIDFYCMALGNSLSIFDLHGALSTPKHGWDSINPVKDVIWETTQRNGKCLFFSCYESPAIHEQDPEKKKLLEKIFITEEVLQEKTETYGKDSDSFYRFVLGFWKRSGIDETVISKSFLDEYDVRKTAEWSGITPLQIVGGLDPAFSQGGDQCIFRLAVMGQDVYGQIVLDFRGEELIFRIPINASINTAIETQIAKYVINVLAKYKCPLGNICIDSNGQGRALGELIRLRAKSVETPLKIYSVRQGNMAVNSFDVIIKTNLELWTNIQKFIQTNQLRGLDITTIAQLTSRKVIVKGSKQILEPKKEYKRRMGAISPTLAHSPDEADTVALTLMAAMLRFGFTPGQRREIRNQTFDDVKYREHLAIIAEEQKHQESIGIEADYSTDLAAAASAGLMDVFGNLPD